MRVHVVLLAAGAMSLGCGSSSEQIGGTLDCAWLEGDNCWKSTAEAAQVLEMSEDVVKQRLHRGRVALRKRLAGYLTPAGKVSA